MSQIILVTGGSRSGKSVIAEEKAIGIGGHSVLYLATAIPTDDDMKERIRIHQARRDPEWGTYEGYRGLGDIIKNTGKSTILLDDITILITNIFFEKDRDFDTIGKDEIAALQDEVLAELSDIIRGAREGNKTLIMVTNEVGMSLTPAYRLGRIFSDVAGKANQHLAALSDEVVFSVCGCAVKIK